MYIYEQIYMTNSLPNVLPASSYRTGCKSASGWIPNPLSIRARIRITKLHPIHDSFFPRRQFRYRSSHLSICHDRHRQKTTRKLFTWARHSSRNRPGRNAKTPSPRPPPWLAGKGHCRGGTYKTRFETIKNRVCATYLVVKRILSCCIAEQS